MQHSDIFVLRLDFGHCYSDCILEGPAAVVVVQHAYLPGRHFDVCLDGDVVVGIFDVMIPLSLYKDVNETLLLGLVL